MLHNYYGSNDTIRKLLGSYLKQLRNSNGMQQKDLAGLFMTGQSAISEYENGKRMPSHATIKKYALLAKDNEDNHIDTIKVADLLELYKTAVKMSSPRTQIQMKILDKPTGIKQNKLDFLFGKQINF